MVVAILADAETKKEIESKGYDAAVEIIWADSLSSLLIIEADAYFDFQFEKDKERTERLKRLLPAPVFINAVSMTTNQAGGNFIRINGWPGMMQRNLVEIAHADSSSNEKVEQVLSKLGWQHLLVPDLPGFVSARVIAMIINEAYFTLEAGISTRENIDIAMKLGTNYPYGPFEWCTKIGLKNVVALLSELSKTDERYNVAPLLLKEANAQSD